MADESNKKNRDDTPPEGRGGKSPKSGRPSETQYSKLIIWVLGALVVIAIVSAGSGSIMSGVRRYKSWTEFIEHVQEGRIRTLEITGQSGRGELGKGPLGDKQSGKPPKFYEVDLPLNWNVISNEEKKFLRDQKVRISFPQPSQFVLVVRFLAPWLIIIGLLWFFFFRHMRGPGGPGGVLSFGKSRATLVVKGDMKKSFADIAGIDEAKEEVEKLIMGRIFNQ